MALSDNERYTLKLKALRMLYNDNYSQTEIAKALNISRVTLNKLIEEAKNDGMIKIDVVDIRNTGKNFSTEIELYKRFKLKNVVLTDCDGLSNEQIVDKIARSGASLFDRYISNDMKIGVTWGRTTKKLATYVSERTNLKNVTVHSLVGTTCDSSSDIQSALVAQILSEKLHATLKIVTAPLLCSNSTLCKELRREPQIAQVLKSARTNDINIVGIGTTIDKSKKNVSTLPLDNSMLDELINAKAVGDIGCNFFDINGKPIKNNTNNRIVTIDLEDLKKCGMVICVGGGKGKEKSILGALRGEYIDVLVTDLQTANAVLELDDQKKKKGKDK